MVINGVDIYSWVEAMESVPHLLPKGLSYLIYEDDNTEVLCTLLDWAVEGLDESKAMAQPESAYKVRHLKMGFKLAGALCTCDPSITIKVMVSGYYLFLKQALVFICTNLLKTLREKEKLLLTSNFSFSDSVFYPFGELPAIFIKFKIVVCKLFRFGTV